MHDGDRPTVAETGRDHLILNYIYVLIQCLPLRQKALDLNLPSLSNSRFDLPAIITRTRSPPVGGEDGQPAPIFTKPEEKVSRGEVGRECVEDTGKYKIHFNMKMSFMYLSSVFH